MMPTRAKPPDIRHLWACALFVFLSGLHSTSSLETNQFHPESCPSGTQADPVYEICTRCHIGFYRERGKSVRCERCPSGFITLEVGAGKVGDCDVPVGLRDSCLSGYEWSSAREKCIECTYGTYRTKGVHYWCISCPDATNTTTEGAVSVAACLGGKDKCPAGTEWNMTTRACEPCKKGTYRQEDQHSACVDCPANHITPFTGAVSPTDCVSVASDEQLFSMDDCPAGTEYDMRLMTCRVCPMNTYRRKEDGMICRPCPDGKVTLRPGATHEVVCLPRDVLHSIKYEHTEDRVPECPAGTEWSDEYMNCAPCPIGTYRNDLTLHLCQKCPQGQETPTQGAISSALCGKTANIEGQMYKMGTCVPGTYWNEVLASCSLCAFGTFSPTGGSCVPCSNGRMTSQRGAVSPDACVLPQIPDYQMPYFTQDSCPSGSEWYPMKGGCQPCPIGYYRLVSPSEGGPTQCQKCLKGFTTFTTGAIYGFMCVIPKTGPLHLPIGTDGCPPGYEANVTVCTVCPRGHYKSTSGWDNCSPCPTHNDEISRDTLASGASDINECVPRVKINAMRPPVGPQAGGTVVTLDVSIDRPVRIMSMSIAGQECRPLSLYITNGPVSCLTSPVRELPVRGSLVVETCHGLMLNSPTPFNYKENPIVDGVNRMKSIKSGGMHFIVYGRNLDSVANPVLMLRPTTMDSQYSALQVACDNFGPSAVDCRLPGLPNSSRRRREVPNEEKRPLAEFNIGIQLDGLQNYSKIQDIYPQYGTMKVYDDPDIFAFENGEMVAPTSMDVITIYGERLDLGSTPADYKVFIGECDAKVLTLTYSNVVAELCRELKDNEIHKVLVEIGHLSFEVGKLRLSPSTSSSSKSKILLPVLLVLLSLLLIVVMVIIGMCVSNKQQKKDRQTAPITIPETRHGSSTLSRVSPIRTVSQRTSKADSEHTIPPLPIDSVFGPERVTDRGVGMRKLALPQDGATIEIEPGEKTDLMRYRIVEPGARDSDINISEGTPKEAWGEIKT